MAHADERGSLERLGQEVSKHNIGRAVLNTELLATDVVGDKEITDVDVLGVLGAETFAIGGQKDAALVVLVHHVVPDSKTLGSEEETGPQNEANGIIHANKFSLSGTAGVKFLFS